MQQQWTVRAIKGAKYFAVGGVLTLAHDAAASHAQGNPMATLVVTILLGIIAPIVMVFGLYLIATRNRQGVGASKE